MEENQPVGAAGKQKNNLVPLIVGGVIVVGAIVAFLVLSKQNAQNESTENTAPTVAEEQTPEPNIIAPTEETQVMEEKSAAAEEPAMPEKIAKAFPLVGTNFTFSFTEIRVKKGDLVRVIFENKSGFHDFSLDEFNVRTKQLQAGETEMVEFVADKTGEFEYYCSVGSHRAMGMRGKFIVE